MQLDMKKIKLTGRLGREFGHEFDLDVRDPAEAIRALCYQIPGFEDSLKQGEYRVTRVYSDGQEIPSSDKDVFLAFGSAAGYRIDPVVGGNRRGLGKLVLGIVLIGAAFFTAGASLTSTAALAETATIGGVSLGVTYGNIAFYGALMALQGAAALLTPTPDNSDRTRESFLLDYTGNIGRQGTAIPIIFGETFIGSVVVSVGITAEDIGGTTNASPATSTGSSTGPQAPTILSGSVMTQ